MNLSAFYCRKVTREVISFGRLIARCAALSALALSLPLTSGGVAAEAVSDFTFIHLSDMHCPRAESKATVAMLRGMGEIDLKPCGVKVPAPEFVIATGDLNEFGGGVMEGKSAWESYLSCWKGIRMPVYPQMGNHDNTWHANIKQMRDGGQAPCYSFDKHGCHFVGLMTATPQDPRPSIGEEQILWLKNDLSKIDPQTPLFVFFHHPLPGKEFASRYDYDRLLDILHNYNTVLLMAGHSHGHVFDHVGGIRHVTGGSTFGPNAGFLVVSVKEGALRAAYWKFGQPAPSIKLIDEPFACPSHPKIEILSPTWRQTLTGNLKISATIANAPEFEKATFTIDDEVDGNLAPAGAGRYESDPGGVSLAKLRPGAHYLRVDFKKGKKAFSRSAQFFIDSPVRAVAWRAYMGSASKSTPTLDGGALYVGANDGKLRAFEAATGKVLWTASTGAEILAQPLACGGVVYSANGLGEVSAFSKDGDKLWTFTAGDAVYSSPVMVSGKIIFGCNDGKIHAIDPKTGAQAWVNEDATYAIESKPFVSDTKVYFGAWDEHLRCIDSADGKIIWKTQGEGSRKAKGAKRYYSPGDAMPVVADGRLFAADRAYALGIFDAQTGQPAASTNSTPANKPAKNTKNGKHAKHGKKAKPSIQNESLSENKFASTGLSEDGHFVYLRKTDGSLTKINSNGKEIWSLSAELGSPIPTAPTEKDGIVYVSSGRGTVSAVAAATGKIIWQYQASPQLWIMSSVACDGTNAYVVSFDGSLTAIKCKQ